MARRKRAFVPERRFRIGFPDKRVPPHHGARDVAGAWCQITGPDRLCPIMPGTVLCSPHRSRRIA